MQRLFRSHPWHGIAIGDKAPEELHTYIEIVPSDTVKYEMDKISGHLMVDRPQLFSNFCPALYGLIPQTYCAEQIAALCMERSNLTGIVGDGDPLDICVLTEKTISHGDILLTAIPIGGLRMIDGNEADDKIIAVMKNDASYGTWRGISEMPAAMIERLRHYFLTYKSHPMAPAPKTEITAVYDRAEAHEVIRRSREDYKVHYGELERILHESLHE